MKTIKFKMSCDTGFAGCTHTADDEIEFEDEATEEEIEKTIEEHTLEWAYGHIDIYHERQQTPPNGN